MNPIQIIFLLGWANIVGLVLVLLSCRCIASMPVSRLLKYRWFQVFYKFHCWYWWFFLGSVALHAYFAITAFGNPL